LATIQEQTDEEQMDALGRSSLEKTLTVQSALNMTTSNHSSKYKRSNPAISGNEIQTQTLVTWVKDGKLQRYHSQSGGGNSPKNLMNSQLIAFEDDFIASGLIQISGHANIAGGEALNQDISHSSTI